MRDDRVDLDRVLALPPERAAALVRLAETPRVGDGDADYAALRTNRVHGLVDLVCSLPPLNLVVEVGSHRGVSTEVFLIFGACVVSVDPDHDADRFRRLMNDYPGRLRVDRGRSPGAAAGYADGAFDLAYLDALHDYESVRAALLAWPRKVRPGGWVAGHDYTTHQGCGGVVRAVDELLGGPDRVFTDTSWLVRGEGVAGRCHGCGSYAAE